MEEVVYVPLFTGKETSSQVPDAIKDQSFSYASVNNPPTNQRKLQNISARNTGATFDSNDTYLIGTVEQDSILQHWNLAAYWRLDGGASAFGLHARIDIVRAGFTIFTTRLILGAVKQAQSANGNPNIALKKGDIVNLIVITEGGTTFTWDIFVAVSAQSYL